MKAIVCAEYGPPEVLQFQDVEKPAPRKNEVCIKIFATTVTVSDCRVRGFNVPPALWLPMGLAIGFAKPRQPILGMVLAGQVESAGTDVTRFKEGDQVVGWDPLGMGAYAEYKCMRANAVLAAKPANVTYEEAAAIPYGGLLALHYLRKGNIQSGQKLLVYGASGAVGTSAVQLGRYFGANLTGACSAANFELVKSLGAEAVLDYTREDLANRTERYDLVLDAAGKRKSSRFKTQCKQALAQNGKYISVDDGSPKMGIEGLELLRQLVESGKLRPVIDRRYPLEQLAEAHRYVEEGHKKGNVVITVQPGN